MSVPLSAAVQFTPRGVCTICQDRLILKKWRGKNNVIAVLHTSSSHPCAYHEKCIRVWAGTRSINSSKCPACTKQISDVTFYACGKKGNPKQLTRHPLQPPPDQDTDVYDQRTGMNIVLFTATYFAVIKDLWTFFHRSV